MAEANHTFKVKIITPERLFFEGEAAMIEFTTTEGDIGVYANHIPLTTVLAPGVVTITGSDDSKKKAGVYSGFAEIQGDKVTLLAENAEWPDEIDEARAGRAEQRARDRLETKAEGLDVVRAELALRKALVRKDLAAVR